MIAFPNGLLHAPALELFPPSPRFFTPNALSFRFDARAPSPERWLAFLQSIWPNDPFSVETLQEMFGYMLFPDTSQQKLFLMVGPRRSGKSTAARVLTQLIGAANVAGPSLASLGTQFGLADLIGKLVAIIADARLSGRSDAALIAERLLSISGEDGLSIPRKFLPDWIGTLKARFLILTNELPAITDASGALASRFIVLNMTRSFYGREDTTLTAKLTVELPGILLWAIEGWRRLQERGRFVQPPSAVEAVLELEELSSPIGAFVKDRCTVGPERSIQAHWLFVEWQKWCDEAGREHPGTIHTFGRNLRAAVPGLTVANHRDGSGRVRVYQGIGLA
jgi:putative DNA primase/helicase